MRFTVRVVGVVPAWRTATAGLAVWPADGSSGLSWLPLPAAASANGEFVLQHALPRSGEVVVAVASDRSFALHGYLSRRTVQVANGATIEVDATAHRTGFLLPADARRAGPFRIVRSDDACWVPMAGAAAGLTLLAGAPQWLWLGAGRHALVDPLQPQRQQAFEVPAPAVIQLSAALAGARADRP